MQLDKGIMHFEFFINFIFPCNFQAFEKIIFNGKILIVSNKHPYYSGILLEISAFFRLIL